MSPMTPAQDALRFALCYKGAGGISEVMSGPRYTLSAMRSRNVQQDANLRALLRRLQKRSRGCSTCAMARPQAI